MNMKISTLLIALIFAIPVMAQAKPHAFPVPFVATNPDHVSNQGITFTDLPGSGSIKIFNILGERVVELPVAPGELLKLWNLNNSSGKAVSTGVYIYIVESGDSKTKGKVVVIR